MVTLTKARLAVRAPFLFLFSLSLLLGRGCLGAGAAKGGAKAQAPAKELPTAKPEEVGMDSKILDEAGQALLKDAMARVIPGAVVMVARHGKVVYSKHVGYDSDNYIFRLFSQSKPVTAVATMLLIEDGTLNLDDPVTKFIPEFAGLRVIKDGTLGAPIETMPLTTPMTIKHLLTHTAGLVYGDGGDTTIDEMYKAAQVLDMWGQDLDGFILKLARIPLLTQPGTEWRYSVAFDVLGAVIQRASGMPFEKFLKERLFKPLDMKDTDFYVPPSKLYRLVPYWVNPGMPGVLVPMPNFYTKTDFTKEPKLKSGGGGMVSTARDYLRLGQMLLSKGTLDGKRFISPELVETFWTNQLPDALMPYKMGAITFTASGFGLGVSIQKWDGNGMAVKGEISWGGAASTNWWLSPELDLVMVGMTQRSPFTNSVPDALKPAVYKSITDTKVFTNPAPKPVVVDDEEEEEEVEAPAGAGAPVLQQQEEEEEEELEVNANGNVE